MDDGLVKFWKVTGGRAFRRQGSMNRRARLKGFSSRANGMSKMDELAVRLLPQGWTPRPRNYRVLIMEIIWAGHGGHLISAV